MAPKSYAALSSLSYVISPSQIHEPKLYYSKNTTKGACSAEKLACHVLAMEKSRVR